MSAFRTIECVFEDGALKPLHEVDFKEGERPNIAAKKFDLSKFVGAFGEGPLEESEAFREEALMGRCDLSEYYGILGKTSAERIAELEGSGCSDDIDLHSAEIGIENDSPVRGTKVIIKAKVGP